MSGAGRTINELITQMRETSSSSIQKFCHCAENTPAIKEDICRGGTLTWIDEQVGDFLAFIMAELITKRSFLFFFWRRRGTYS